MIRVFLVDDEAPARKRLRKMLDASVETGRVAIVGEASDGLDAVRQINSLDVDLVLLDIRMPGLDGFAVLERLDPARRPEVVFTTAYDEYAIRAFEANAVDYLLKPVARERLDEAIARAERFVGSRGAAGDERVSRLLDWVEAQIEAEGGSSVQPVALTAPAIADGPVKHVSIPYRDRILVTPVELVVSAEIADGITRLHVLEEVPPGTKPRVKAHIVAYTLDQLAAMLDAETFMRVHRSAIVQFDHIREIIPWFSGRYKLILTGGHEVIASRERSKVIKERLKI